MQKRLVKVSALEAESGERSEADGTVRALGRADPEVLENPTRRKFTARGFNHGIPLEQGIEPERAFSNYAVSFHSERGGS